MSRNVIVAELDSDGSKMLVRSVVDSRSLRSPGVWTAWTRKWVTLDVNGVSIQPGDQIAIWLPDVGQPEEIFTFVGEAGKASQSGGVVSIFSDIGGGIGSGIGGIGSGIGSLGSLFGRTTTAPEP